MLSFISTYCVTFSNSRHFSNLMKDKEIPTFQLSSSTVEDIVVFIIRRKISQNQNQNQNHIKLGIYMHL